MTDMNDDDEAYLVVPEGTDIKQVVNMDTVWAKIGDKGELEVLRWDLIEMYSNDYDSSDKHRTQTHVMCKLLVLVREQVRRQYEKL
jgi:hypothetical protein